MTNFAEKVTTPDPETINPLCHNARISTMSSILGAPQMPLSQECQDSQASQQVKQLLETRDVGLPTEVRGIKPFLDLLTRVFARVKAGNADLYAALDTAGVLCVRYVRGSTTISNHSWGAAIDMSMFNPDTGKHELDLPLGNGTVQIGCLELYKFFEEDGKATGEWCFWGAGFGREDGMHFEASNELVRMWRNQGKI